MTTSLQIAKRENEDLKSEIQMLKDHINSKEREKLMMMN